MASSSDSTDEIPAVPRDAFENVKSIVTSHFQIEEALLEHGIPTFYLIRGQETKKPFLALLERLRSLNQIALLRQMDGRTVLRVIPKPEVKPSNILVNWLLLFATMATTFYTGYLLSSGAAESGMVIDPVLGGVAFMAAIMAVLGTHEMGHKLFANRNKMEATSPYFIPGPPPIIGGFGTFGAVIMQKSLPPNRDALFDIGSSGPITGFIVATAVAVIGFPFSSYVLINSGEPSLPPPLLFSIIELFFHPSGLIPTPGPGQVVGIALHPVLFAGWVGMIVTMLNLLPTGMLDGGHVAQAVLRGKFRWAFLALSVVYLVFTGFIPMAILVLFLSMYKHPGPLDDVSSLSLGRRLLVIGLIAIFVLSTFQGFALF